MDDEDRFRYGHPGGHVDEDGVRHERVVEEHQRVATDLGPTDHLRAAGHVVGAAETEGALPLGYVERQRVAVVDHSLRRELTDGGRHQLPEDLPFLGQGPGRGDGWRKLLELELVDGRVAPDFFAF